MVLSNVPSVSLSEVLHLALPTGSRVLIGESGLARRVHWARVLRVRPTGLGTFDAGELLVIPAQLLESVGEPRSLPRLIAELVEAGVSAFVVPGRPHEEMMAACRANDIPLLQIPPDASLAEVERAIIALILDRDAQLRRRADDVYGRLLETMLGNAGLPALLHALAEATDLRVAVLDEYLTLQACSPEDEAYKHSLTAAAAVLLSDSGGAVPQPGRPLWVRFEEDDVTWGGQLYPLQIGAAWAGYLALFGRGGHAGELDRLLSDRAATLVALELAKQRAVAEATQRSRGEFLDDLLEGSFPNEEAVLARGRQLGYDLLSTSLTFVLGADPPDLPMGGDGHARALRQRRRFVEIARAELNRVEPRALSVERDGDVVALVPTRESTSAVAASTLVERVRSGIEETLPEARVSAGIGRTVYQPRDFVSAQREATQALVIGQKLMGGGRTVHYSLLGVERLLYHLLGHPELERFALDTLGELMRYDALHRGELVRTLEVFLSCNGNHVRAAQELHLHRNTLLYRLERAREILGRDLEDADTRLAIQLAIRIRGAVSPDSVQNGDTTRRPTSRRRRTATSSKSSG